MGAPTLSHWCRRLLTRIAPSSSPIRQLTSTATARIGARHTGTQPCSGDTCRPLGAAEARAPRRRRDTLKQGYRQGRAQSPQAAQRQRRAAPAGPALRTQAVCAPAAARTRPARRRSRLGSRAPVSAPRVNKRSAGTQSAAPRTSRYHVLLGTCTSAVAGSAGSCALRAIWDRVPFSGLTEYMRYR